MRPIALIAAFSTAALFASCRPANPARTLLPPDRLARVYTDLLVAAESTNNRAATDSVLAAYSIGRNDLDASTAEVNEDVKQWRPILETAVTILENRVRRATAP